MDGIADQTAKLAIQEDGIVNALGCVFAPESCTQETKPGQN